MIYLTEVKVLLKLLCMTKRKYIKPKVGMKKVKLNMFYQHKSFESFEFLLAQYPAVKMCEGTICWCSGSGSPC